MTRREGTLLAAAVLVAGVCLRLGVWQIERLRERRAYNMTVLSAYARPPVPLESLSGEPLSNLYRRVLVAGRYDPEHDLVLVNRPHRGSPGVHLATPLRCRDSDTAVLVVRGWVYAPDAYSVDLGRWREDSAAGKIGFVQLYDEQAAGQLPSAGGPAIHALHYPAISGRVSYPLAPYLVVLTDSSGDSSNNSDRPRRLDEPALGEGSHMSYAFQWFSFAAIALAGSIVFIRHSRLVRSGRDASPFEPQ